MMELSPILIGLIVGVIVAVCVYRVGVAVLDWAKHRRAARE